MKILATSFDYRPKLGGIATLAYHLLREMAELPETEIRLIAPSEPGFEKFDSHSKFKTLRLNLKEPWTKSVLTLTGHTLKEVVRWRPDALLSFLWAPDGVSSLICNPILRMMGTRTFLFAYGVEVLESKSTLKKKVRSLLSPVKQTIFKSADGVFAISHFTRDLVMKHCGVPSERIHLVYPGVDSLEFAPASPAQDLAKKHGLQNRKVFLTVSRLWDYKGIDRAIAALRFVIQKHPEAVYLICGDGPDRKRLESLVRHYRVESHVIFAGSVPFNRLKDYYNLADAFVLISRDDWETPNVEGFGIVFMEAAACGKPSIGGNSGGIPDVIIPGKTGWLVDPSDDRAIADAMIESIEKSDATREMGVHARERALSDFTWNKMAIAVSKGIKGHVRD